jgi:hypothetical protein
MTTPPIELRDLLRERRHPAITAAFYLVLTAGVFTIICSAFAIVGGDEAAMVFRLGLAGVIFSLPAAGLVGWFICHRRPIPCNLPPNPWAAPGPAVVDPLVLDPHANRRAYWWVAGLSLGVSIVVLVISICLMARAEQMAATFFK